jgi:hypothetical protein
MIYLIYCKNFCKHHKYPQHNSNNKGSTFDNKILKFIPNQHFVDKLNLLNKTGIGVQILS